MKILHVAETIRGGVGTYLNEVVPLQAGDLGVDSVRVLAPASHSAQIESIDPRCKHWFNRRGRSPASLASLLKQLHCIVRDFAPDVIHAHSTFAGAMVRLSFGFRSRRPRIIYSPHGWVWSTVRTPVKRALFARAETLLAKGCDRIVAVSKDEASQAKKVGISASQIAVVVNGLSPVAPKATASTWDDRRRKVLFVGRLDRQKGFDVLMPAAAELIDQVSIRVVGEAVVGKGGLALVPENVELLGWRTAAEVEGHMLSADLVVIPSRWEGLPLVALEAMRAGKPVIASAVGGIVEVVVHGVTGRLIQPDDVDRLRQALLLDDDAALAAMGQVARARFIDEFGINRVHQGLIAEYCSVLGVFAPNLSTSRQDQHRRGLLEVEHREPCVEEV